MTGCGDDIIDGFCREALGGLDCCEKLAGDASTREYYRASFHDATRIASRDPSFINVPLELYPYFHVYTLFQEHRVPVPRVLRFDSARGLLLLEDAGELMLEDLVAATGLDAARPVYERLIDILVDIQAIPADGSIPFTRAFDVEKLMFEFNFFTEHALVEFFGARLSPSVRNELERAFLRVSESLQRRDLFVLNHRDYHSRNVMVRGDDIFIIDFQDARLGLPHYDLVSLLRDSYVGLDDALFEDLKRRYCDASRGRGVQSLGAEEFERYFVLSAFQRSVKAMGTYGYQSARRGKKLYEKYLDRALGYLPGYAARDAGLAAVTDIILDIAGEAG
jgi:hypothetical protein